jgi:hypothetical protein
LGSGRGRPVCTRWEGWFWCYHPLVHPAGRRRYPHDHGGQREHVRGAGHGPGVGRWPWYGRKSPPLARWPLARTMTWPSTGRSCAHTRTLYALRETQLVHYAERKGMPSSYRLVSRRGDKCGSKASLGGWTPGCWAEVLVPALAGVEGVTGGYTFGKDDERDGFGETSTGRFAASRRRIG